MHLWLWSKVYIHALILKRDKDSPLEVYPIEQESQPVVVPFAQWHVAAND
jgi:hypothetical protein